jgi:hypothetical protein
MAACADSNTHPSLSSVVIDDPDTLVSGETVAQWVEDYIRWTFQAPFGPTSTINDPTGSIADALNPCGGQMYFITGAPSGSDRTFHIRMGEPVLVPVRVAVDSEGPGIPPEFPDPMARVNEVLNGLTFTDGSVTLDGETISDLPVLNTGIFSAGVATEGTVGQVITGANSGASLETTGAKGYFVVLNGLSPGVHELKDSSVLNGAVSTHTDHLIVG